MTLARFRSSIIALEIVALILGAPVRADDDGHLSNMFGQLKELPAGSVPLFFQKLDVAKINEIGRPQTDSLLYQNPEYQMLVARFGGSVVQSYNAAFNSRFSVKVSDYQISAGDLLRMAVQVATASNQFSPQTLRNEISPSVSLLDR